jgi:hypothetical protein
MQSPTAWCKLLCRAPNCKAVRNNLLSISNGRRQQQQRPLLLCQCCRQVGYYHRNHGAYWCPLGLQQVRQAYETINVSNGNTAAPAKPGIKAARHLSSRQPCQPATAGRCSMGCAVMATERTDVVDGILEVQQDYRAD